MDHSKCPENEMEPIRLTLEPYGSIYPDLPHEGEEFGYVLSGQVKIHLGQKVHQAKKGMLFILHLLKNTI